MSILLLFNDRDSSVDSSVNVLSFILVAFIGQVCLFCRFYRFLLVSSSSSVTFLSSSSPCGIRDDFVPGLFRIHWRPAPVLYIYIYIYIYIYLYARAAHLSL